MLLHIVTIICLLLILAIIALFDYLFAITLWWQANAVSIILAAFVVTLAWKVTKKSMYFGYLAMFLALLATVRLVEANPKKPFRQFYNSLHQGVKLEDINHNLKVYFPDQGKYKRPTVNSFHNSLVFVLDPTDGRYNAENIQVILENNRVASATYSPD